MKNEPNLPNVACPDSSGESQRREKASVASLGNRHRRLYECLWTWNRSELQISLELETRTFWFYSGCANFFDPNCQNNKLF
ncbi:hypothetical protein ALC57_12850 [Trachymyrmex cornetzi]|uniref:Uncharacterized protein n=1 Tax=Trachymyrmex cornetzi TaxID=471704 RepID=A0A151J0E4_9HYME|nr:hypothetical protein ALC57_12850 [Trachymyrmex cornetzi]